jgi:threonine synthase
MGQFRLPDGHAFDSIHQDFGFASGRSTHQNRLHTIHDVYQKHQHVIDPHTADGVFVAQSFVSPNIPMVVLETALPVKFAKTIEQAIGHSPDVPVQFQHLEHLPQKVEVMSNDVQKIKDFISLHCSA